MEAGCPKSTSEHQWVERSAPTQPHRGQHPQCYCGWTTHAQAFSLQISLAVGVQSPLGRWIVKEKEKIYTEFSLSPE